MLALLPLAFVLLHTDEDTFLARLLETKENATEEERERIDRVLEELEAEESLDKAALDRLLNALPNRRLAGAFLPRNTWAHWIFAFGTAILFMAFFLLLSTHDTAEPVHILASGLFTATVGIGLLLLIQGIAFRAQGVPLPCFLVWIVKLIGFSYMAALNPHNGFLLSLIGFTLGVGLCEEVVKALPLIWYYREPRSQSWRGAFLWGLASGAGFGIAEAIMYSSDYYNGIHGAGIYLVRFISCVALHALWTGSVGITINQHQELFQQDKEHWYDIVAPVLFVIAVPMLLHGLYDTFLKKDMNAAALGVAVLSFLFLAFQISRLHSADDQEATAEMLREYRRRGATS